MKRVIEEHEEYDEVESEEQVVDERLPVQQLLAAVQLNGHLGHPPGQGRNRTVGEILLRRNCLRLRRGSAGEADLLEDFAGAETFAGGSIPSGRSAGTGIQ